MSTPSPPFMGDIITASKQALLYEGVMANLPSADKPVAADMRQLTTHAQAWVVLRYKSGRMRPIPAKLAGYDCSPQLYPKVRMGMSGTRAVVAISHWAPQVDDADSGTQAVRDFCAAHGLIPRDGIRVLVSREVLPDVEEIEQAPDKDRIIADLICAVLPHLDAAERMRVADFARRL